jgi:hypothetical protein
MDWKEMITGSKAALMLIIFFIGVVITVAVYSFIGLFIGGSLEAAGTAASFSTQVTTGMNTTVTNLITNIGLAQTPISFFGTLLLVIFVLAVFGGIVYLGYGAYKKGKEGGSGSSMDY